MEAKLSRVLVLVANKGYELLFSVAEIDFHEGIWLIWWKIREKVIIPMVNFAVILCLVMSIMVFIEKVSMCAASLYAKVFRRRPQRIYKCDPIAGDEETGNLAYPMVLVQVPMYNEKEVYQLSVGAACNISWPSNRIIIQVLDDSTDPIIKELVRNECEKWLKKGKNIKYETRNNRNGYKAGALKVGMTYDYVQPCEYVAMFDADFQPSPDFLMRTIPFLVHNPDIALVQARWKFVNANECLMTRMQEMSMDYHFKVEQESGSSTVAFFGFNGTAGVWRIQAINDAGGWQDRTTVEDMDLAVRAGLKAWKFVYVGNVQVKSELPSTFKAYRYQQHRWSCGPANLFRKMLWDVIYAKKVSLWKKFYVIYSFFIARRIVSHTVTFFFYCVVIPFSVFFPEVEIPKWGMVYLPTTITLLNCVGTPRSIHLVIFWVLFENVMALHRCKAVFIGLLEAGRANEWVVTEKLGDLLKSNSAASIAKRFQSKFWERFHILELVAGAYLVLCALYDYVYRDDYYFIYIFPQAISFIIMGFGYIGTIVPRDK
ncbi:glucomannan 4-beta-mannosyltransferase 1-like [Asparagus officinalis]|uniref:glucomannan 4-beta-mannosyltransferase 1-like n=1 Tax=Asparagus officinalis TaxID=4686 RepID=UPI00098E80C6|nr:glucomannan 4-beta-mannosyltransferase 1-like [Asparagus officinalis]